MRRKRKGIHYLILALAVAIAAVMFAVPLADSALLTGGAESSFMQLCGTLAKALSREKNVGLALTLLAMVMGFVGVVIAALLTPFIRSLRKTRDGIGAFAGLLTLVPLILLAAENPQMLELCAIAAPDAGGRGVLTPGGYALGALAILFSLLCASGLLVGIHLKTAAVKRPRQVPKPQAVRDEAKRARDDKRAQAENGAPGESPDASGGQEPKKEEPKDESARAAEADPEITVVYTTEIGPVRGVIEGLEGVYAGARIELGAGEEILFGRNPRYAHVVIDRNNADISRKHCGVSVEEASGKFLVTDYSRNGTFARAAEAGEEMRLPVKKATRLPQGTVIRLGRQGNVFLLK